MSLTPQDIAAARLRAAGIAEEAIPELLARAAALVEGLSKLAELDPELPEPALTWRPVGAADEEAE
ncbi:MAG TPA: hypothetical protein VFZ25_04945 [Chloroflexota bacterium]|nr:hypothetical protein [Chloroflexota bacterium]